MGSNKLENILTTITTIAVLRRLMINLTSHRLPPVEYVDVPLGSRHISAATLVLSESSRPFKGP